MLSPFFLV